MSGGAARRVVFAVPGDLGTPSGGYGYDRRMIRELANLGWQIEVLRLPDAFPRPGAEDLRRSADAFAALPDGTLVLVDGLAFGALPDLARDEGRRLRLAALVHHPLALEDGLACEEAARLRASEREALRHARAVVATSGATARLLARDFAVEAPVAVAPPGTEPALAAPSGPSAPAAEPLVLCVAALIPRKDHALLMDALARLRDRPWRCRLVGSDRADPRTAQLLRERICLAGLGGRVEIAGAVADVAAEYRAADIFALASRFEGYGMAFAEALAAGLPVVGCDGGAVAEVVPPEAGLLVPPGDLDAFAAALAMLLDDPSRRAALAAGASAAAGALPRWEGSACILSDALERAR